MQAGVFTFVRARLPEISTRAAIVTKPRVSTPERSATNPSLALSLEPPRTRDPSPDPRYVSGLNCLANRSPSRWTRSVSLLKRSTG